MLSEKEAAEKSCPLLVPAYLMADQFDRQFLAKSCKCKSSVCIAWRWEDNRHERGYCGLAGKPVVP